MQIKMRKNLIYANIRVRSHLAITTQTFYVVNATFEMGCILAQVTLHTRRQKKMTKNASLSSSANGYLGAEILTLWLLKQ